MTASNCSRAFMLGAALFSAAASLSISATNLASWAARSFLPLASFSFLHSKRALEQNKRVHDV